MAEVVDAEVLDVESAAAVPKGEVADLAGSMATQVEHGLESVRGSGHLPFGETPGRPAVAGVQQHVDRRVQLTDVQLVADLEGADPRDQRMIRLGDLDLIGRDRGVAEELAAQHRGHRSEHPRRREQTLPARRGRLDRRVGGVQCQPPPAARHEVHQDPLLLTAGTHVTGVGDE